jgi:Bacterial archaeo-eukaryotic release factor family 3
VNRALLAELQRQQAYPSITVLINTTPGAALSASEIDTARRLADHADKRLTDDVPDEVRAAVIGSLHSLIAEQSGEVNGKAMALCVSPNYTAAVRLGREVQERVVVDDTFATRDLVADANRTAMFRMVTISERKVRLLIGDRQRLAEQRDEMWPMLRLDDQSVQAWYREVTERLRSEHAALPLPTVIAGVERSVRSAVVPDLFDAIGLVAGNHDRTSWVDLHHAAWPLVTDWLRSDHDRAMAALESARSAKRFAGGIDEIWPLANEGRVELLVVEENFVLAARVDENLQLERVDDHEAPDVVDDIVDETIEAVLRNGGSTVIVNDTALGEHERIAAILRY